MKMKPSRRISSKGVVKVTLSIILMVIMVFTYPSSTHLEMGASASDHSDSKINGNVPSPNPLSPNNWTNMYPSSKPGPRYGHTMAYDSQDDRVILFGGVYQNNFIGETWVYDYKTNNWTNMNPGEKPSPRIWASMAYDPKVGRSMLFGGWTNPSNGWAGDTWAYDYKNNTWSNRTPTQTNHPSGRRGQTMVYDSSADRMILFGGVDAAGLRDDTWEYDYKGNLWKLRYPSTAPSPLDFHVMAYNSKAKQAILFGGYDGSGYRNDTWTYDYVSNNWTKKTLNVAPIPRVYSAMVYDSKADRTILFAGGDLYRKDDTWTYDLNYNTWARQYPSVKPVGRIGHSMAYDPNANRTILFGGSDGSNYLGDTWVYEPIGGTQSGPYVVSTMPHDGDINVPVNTNIVITFSTSMDTGPTEGAISSVPPISGSFNWDGTAHTVTWAPSSNLLRPVKYTITISTQARSVIGINMKYPYVFSFTTIPPPDIYPPYIVNTSPANGQNNVSVASNIAITWNESMNRTSAQNAFLPSPSITCIWSWTTLVQTCMPSVPLQFNKTYIIIITTSAKDPSGNYMAKSYEFVFNTSQIPDVYPPYVVSTSPTDGATNVSNATKIDIRWNETMNRTSAELAFASSPSITCIWSWSGVNQTCTPTSVLQSSTKYQVSISSMAKDLAGNAMKSEYSFSFTTAGGAPVPPTVISTSPQNDTVNVSINANIAIEFSLAMNESVTEGAISSSPSITGSFAWDGAAKNVTWDPAADLASNTKYTITVSTSARSQSGLNMLKPYAFSFTTSSLPPDASPPYVTATDPKDKDTNVPTSAKIAITWNESMNTPSAESAFSSTPAIACAWSWSGATQTCSPTAALKASTKYSMTIATTAKDLAGNAMKDLYAFSFTTASGVVPTPPKVMATNPVNGTSNVPLDAKISITFDKAMDMLATEGATSASPSIAWTGAWSSGDTVVTFKPSASLQVNTQYAITVSAGARSSDGAYLASPYTFSFKTRISPDATPPTVISTDPTNGQTDVDKNSKVTITFSEGMDTTVTSGAVSISPGTITGKVWGSKDTTLTLSVELEDGTTYTVTVSTDAKDAAGNAMVSSHTFTFTTKSSSAWGIGEIALFLGVIVLIIIIIVLVLLGLLRLKKRARCPECGEPYPKDASVCPSCGYDFIRKTRKPLLLKEGRKPSLQTAKEAPKAQAVRPEAEGARQYPVAVPIARSAVEERPKARRMGLAATKKEDIERSEEEVRSRPKARGVVQCEKCGTAYAEGGNCPYCGKSEDVAERRKRARERMLKKEDIERSEEETGSVRSDEVAEKRRRARERMLRRKRGS